MTYGITGLERVKDRRGYSHLKEEALDRTIWRHRFGGGFGPVVRQNTEWMNECFTSVGFEDVDWMHLAQDIVQCLDATCMVVTLFMFLKGKEFLDQLSDCHLLHKKIALWSSQLPLASKYEIKIVEKKVLQYEIILVLKPWWIMVYPVKHLYKHAHFCYSYWATVCSYSMRYAEGCHAMPVLWCQWMYNNVIVHIYRSALRPGTFIL